MINLYSTCSTSYFSIGIYRIHLFTTAATDLKATIEVAVLSLLLHLGRYVTIHQKRTESTATVILVAFSFNVQCKLNYYCLSTRQCNVEGKGHNKRQRGAGWEYLTKSKNTLESRGRSGISFLSLRTS
jgi:hypothetical protein